MTDLADRPAAPAIQTQTQTQTQTLAELNAPARLSAGIEIESDRVRFAGLSQGALTWAGAWIVGAAIARLTGAAAVLLVLAGTLVAFAGAVVSARRGARQFVVEELSIAPLTTVDGQTPFALRLDGPTSVQDGEINVFDGIDLLATVSFAALDDTGTAHLDASFPHGGVIDELSVEITTAGTAGVVWVRRRVRVDIDPVAIAPHPVDPGVAIQDATSNADGTVVTEHGPKHGEVDGIRLWRDGDGDAAVHWPSTLRSGSLVVHDRQASLDRKWIVEAPSSGVDEQLAGRLAHTMLEGLRCGHQVVLRRTSAAVPGTTTNQATPSGPTSAHTTSADTSSADTLIVSSEDARRHSAEMIGPHLPSATPRQRWYRRTLRATARTDTFTDVSPNARWLSALASLIALGMLIGALSVAPSTIGLGIGGLMLGAVVSLRASRSDTKPLWLRLFVTAATLGALASIATTVGGVNGLLAALRGPMPDLLMLLLVIHGFEVVNRRTLRVHQAISGVIIAYAAGLRIDDRVGLWLAAWAVAIVLAVRSTSRRPIAAQPTAAQSDTSGSAAQRLARPAGAILAATVATLALLLVIPVPDGPARLGLPALSNDAPAAPSSGALAGPGGGPPAPSDGTRGSLGQVGGYPGFAETMDTSVRGDLGNEIVMRVRAPQPDFWRGQTFSEFDGRLWTASPERGQRRDGPQIEVPMTIGDGARPRTGAVVEPLIQTYYVEAELPNVIFAAARPDVVTFDGSVFTRPDGALRSSVTLTKGSVYTVISERVVVTSQLLRAQGDIAEDFAAITNPRLREAVDPFLMVPESTSQRTIDLATRVRDPGESTYDTILAYQDWLALNTEYDLDAPIPAEGADAVDDFLFVSQRGFCEQIASSLAIMLRSQGIPARIATGYVPGVRDKVSGVFEVRASDAHAWVEVWFPDSGWQAFDPTASVPLSGEADQGSVGGDLLSAAISGVASRPVEVGMFVAVGLSLLGLFRWVAERLRRHRRGRWGVLQDEFASTTNVGARTNPQRASTFTDPSLRTTAERLASQLDAVVFDPDWDDTDQAYGDARSLLTELRRAIEHQAGRQQPAKRRSGRSLLPR